MNGAACVAWPAAHVQNPQPLVSRKWNRCGDELQRSWLGGPLLRAPQIEPCFEIFAAKFILDRGLSGDFHWFLSFRVRKYTDTSLSHADGEKYWKNLTTIDGGCQSWRVRLRNSTGLSPEKDLNSLMKWDWS